MADADAAVADAGENPGHKFRCKDMTARGEPRAHVAFTTLQTLWVNTGTLCNIECANCYIESSPGNDRLEYMTYTELMPFLKEAAQMDAAEIGFTGGEPFMNPDMIAMTRDSLEAGFRVLILTNAMRPMMRPGVHGALRDLVKRYGARLTLRVSLDHYTKAGHDAQRGEGSFDIAIDGVKALIADDADITIAGRSLYGESEAATRAGFARLCKDLGLSLDADDPHQLVLFPEMDACADTPEITEGCWRILGKNPQDMMCANTRMVVKRKGAARPSVLACTLIAYDSAFELGDDLAGATSKDVYLNHPHCSRFCVLGGANCSG